MTGPTFLRPLKEFVERGRSAADDLLARYHGEWGGDVEAGLHRKRLLDSSAPLIGRGGLDAFLQAWWARRRLTSFLDRISLAFASRISQLDLKKKRLAERLTSRKSLILK